ncbi:hypothetical protein GUJ93_ZPchr0001g32245 [Zizania palustris]|uniref:Uncharacterized protein n=1 Tax=Zizania palustris TaxID=103762 RepID=A0A8J5VT51_ZIZPA|nr:hypothetical protein GUJ93_ZPchr0001g32245 [Zizania palustris]
MGAPRIAARRGHGGTAVGRSEFAGRQEEDERGVRRKEKTRNKTKKEKKIKRKKRDIKKFDVVGSYLLDVNAQPRGQPPP